MLVWVHFIFISGGGVYGQIMCTQIKVVMDILMLDTITCKKLISIKNSMCTQNIILPIFPIFSKCWPQVGIPFEFWPNMQQLCPHWNCYYKIEFYDGTCIQNHVWLIFFLNTSFFYIWIIIPYSLRLYHCHYTIKCLPTVTIHVWFSL